MAKGGGDIQYRVFHLGTECYVIYLGSDREDENPFLRIGNIPNIPEELHGITSRIIITSSFTGNPFQEVRYARKHKLSYLGDVEVIDHFRRFFQSLNLPARELTDYRQVQEAGNRHTLYFYNNGNIHLNFDSQLLFDLQKREQADLHCLQRCDQMKNLLLKNPLRYTREELNKPAFFISEKGKFYLYHKEWMALDLENRYFSGLASQGIDPDEVHALFTHVPEEDMGLDERESLVQHIKRRVLRNKTLSILTTRPEIPEHLIKLFPGPEGGSGSPVKPVLLKDGGKWDHGDMSAEISRDNLLVRFAGDNALFIPFGSNQELPVREAGWHVSADRRSLTWRRKDGSETELHTLRGYPLVLEKDPPEKGKLTEKYLGFLHSYLEAWKGRDHWDSLYEMETLLSGVLEGGDLSGKESVPSLRAPVTPGLEYLFLTNLRTLLSQTGAAAEKFAGMLEDVLGSWEAPSPLLPVLGDLYHGEKGPFILYRISTHKLNPYNFRKAGEISDQMLQLETPDQELFRKEKQRLLDLLQSLYGVQPRFPQTQSRDSKPAAAAPPARKPAPASSTSPASSKQGAPGAESSLGAPEAASASKRKTAAGPAMKKRSPARGRRLPLPLMILLLLLLAGGAGFGLFTLLRPSSGDTAGRDLPVAQADPSGPSGETAQPPEEQPRTGSDEGSPETALRENGESAETAAADTAGSDADGSAAAVSGTQIASGDDPSSGTGADTGEPGSGTPDDGAAPGTDTAAAPPDTAAAAPATEDNGSTGTAGADTAVPVSGDSAEEEIPVTPPPVETERRPSTQAEALAYLRIDEIEITLVDIHLVSNAIAVRNGYRDLDYRVFEGKDPDWIWTGNTLILPDETAYTVIRGDSIWFIASRLIRRDVENSLTRLAEIDNRLERDDLPPGERDQLVGELEAMAGSTLSEQLRERINSKLSSLN